MGAAAQEETGMPFMQSYLTKLGKDNVETERIGRRGDSDRLSGQEVVKVAEKQEALRSD